MSRNSATIHPIKWTASANKPLHDWLSAGKKRSTCIRRSHFVLQEYVRAQKLCISSDHFDLPAVGRLCLKVRCYEKCPESCSHTRNPFGTFDRKHHFLEQDPTGEDAGHGNTSMKAASALQSFSMMGSVRYTEIALQLKVFMARTESDESYCAHVRL